MLVSMKTGTQHRPKNTRFRCYNVGHQKVRPFWDPYMEGYFEFPQLDTKYAYRHKYAQGTRYTLTTNHVENPTSYIYIYMYIYIYSFIYFFIDLLICLVYLYIHTLAPLSTPMSSQCLCHGPCSFPLDSPL